MTKRIFFFIAFIYGCNNEQKAKSKIDFFEGRKLWENRCQPCHPYLTTEGLNQTSLSQMRETERSELYRKVALVIKDSNHTKPIFNVNNIEDSNISKIIFYIKKTGEPTP